MKFTLLSLEYFILILVRISAFIFIAPFFGITNMPARIKVGLSVFIAIILFETIDYNPISYHSELEYACIVLKEVIVGLVIGFFANICASILSFAGHMIDTDIGFSMIQILDPVTKVQTTVSGNFYSYLVTIMLIITDFHHYLIYALVDAFTIIPIGTVKFKPTLYEAMLNFLTDYFVIGFRIVLPIFAAMLLVNSVLAILAKVAPQMNMFVIGIQLKLFVGLITLFLIVGLLPSVSDFIFEEIKKMVELAISGMS